MNGAFWSTPVGRTLNVVAMLAVLFAVWQSAVAGFHIRAFLLPAPSMIFAALLADPVFYLRHTAETLYETMLGFSAALVLGTIMAIGVISSRFVEQTLYTLLIALHSIPKIALAPLFIIWLGTDLQPKVAIAMLIAIFPIVIDTVLGLRTVDPDMLDLGRSLRGGRQRILWKIRFPSALPSMFAGCKVGISMAFSGAIVGEFVSSQAGLGYLIISSQANFDTTRMFAAMMLLAIVGTGLFFVVEFTEGAVIPWHVSRRRSGGMAGH
jgi:NitT/TauT family transport system permease protein